MTTIVLNPPVQNVIRLKMRHRTETLSAIQPVDQEDVKVKKWARYTEVALSNLDNIELKEFKHSHLRIDYLKKVFTMKFNCPLNFQDSSTAYRFFWATYLIARGEPTLEEYRELGTPVEWLSLYDFANFNVDRFLKVVPELDHPQYLPSIHLTAMLVVLKCHFDLRIWDIDALRALHFLGGIREDFKSLLLMNEIVPSVNITGLTFYRIYKMERIFLKTLNHELARTL